MVIHYLRPNSQDKKPLERNSLLPSTMNFESHQCTNVSYIHTHISRSNIQFMHLISTAKLVYVCYLKKSIMPLKVAYTTCKHMSIMVDYIHKTIFHLHWSQQLYWEKYAIKKAYHATQNDKNETTFNTI